MTHETFMQRALDLAQSVLTTTPNPRVGCVIVQNGHVVGEGFHQRAGEPHAEVNALREAGARACGSTVYVTLEPCAHTGRTGPCAEALVAAGVGEVIYAMQDPDPRVSGRGLAILREAGIAVQGPVLGHAAEAVNRGFVRRLREQRPWVRCKMAMSLDGRTAMASGESKWITGPAARADVQRLRASSCAVLTGVNTVLHDDPSMNVRPEQLPPSVSLVDPVQQPYRVIIDSRLRTPPGARILQLPGSVLLMTGTLPAAQRTAFHDAIADEGVASERVQIYDCAGAATQVDLQAVLHRLATDYQCNEVMVEAGPTLGGALLQAGLVDELVVYIGGKLLGSEAMPLFVLPGMQRMQDQIALTLTDVRQLDGDCRISALVKSRAV